MNEITSEFIKLFDPYVATQEYMNNQYPDELFGGPENEWAIRARALLTKLEDGTLIIIETSL